MKLETTIDDLLPNGPNEPELRDALRAHALVQAMEEAFNDPFCALAVVPIKAMVKRADEILRNEMGMEL